MTRPTDPPVQGEFAVMVERGRQPTDNAAIGQALQAWNDVFTDDFLDACKTLQAEACMHKSSAPMAQFTHFLNNRANGVNMIIQAAILRPDFFTAKQADELGKLKAALLESLAESPIMASNDIAPFVKEPKNVDKVRDAVAVVKQFAQALRVFSEEFDRARSGMQSGKISR